MRDTIYRDDAIRVASGYCHPANVAKELEKLPSAQPKTGRWINANDGKWNAVTVFKCSACGEIDNRMYETDNYCPHCGAKMEVDDGTN